jgi:hypothetical protein
MFFSKIPSLGFLIILANTKNNFEKNNVKNKNSKKKMIPAHGRRISNRSGGKNL